MDHYITQIRIEELRHLLDICIPLKPEKRANLLLTGKNGSGKTTVLRALKKYLQAIADGNMKDVKEKYPGYIAQYRQAMENAGSESERYEAQKRYQLWQENVVGIVLIDELETHLHIGLQKTNLPFLTKFFPKIQFIVSTHSPYILNSVENCVIYDLEKRIRLEDMSQYSAEGIVEGYFELETYSDILMKKVKRYQSLVENVNPTEDERAEA